MKKQLDDKYKQLKPEAFKYEEEVTPGFWFGIVLTVMALGFVIMFVIFLLAIFILAGR